MSNIRLDFDPTVDVLPNLMLQLPGSTAQQIINEAAAAHRKIVTERIKSGDGIDLRMGVNAIFDTLHRVIFDNGELEFALASITQSINLPYVSLKTAALTIGDWEKELNPDGNRRDRQNPPSFII